MSLEAIITLAVALAIFIASPGPGIFALVARTLAGGFAAGMALSVGLLAGDIVFMLAAASGMSALAASMGEVFVVLKIAGGLYLVWMGIQAWRAPAQPLALDGAGVPLAPRGLTWREVPGTLVAGFLVTMSNPKAILFYAAILPTLLDLQALDALGLAEAAGVLAVVALSVCAAYCAAAARARRLFRSAQAMRRLNKGSAALLVGAGAVVATH